MTAAAPRRARTSRSPERERAGVAGPLVQRIGCSRLRLDVDARGDRVAVLRAVERGRTEVVERVLLCVGQAALGERLLRRAIDGYVARVERVRALVADQDDHAVLPRVLEAQRDVLTAGR